MIFAISMDYTVFLLASAKEHYDRTGDPREAMIGGVAHSGRVIFAAAAVMVAVFFTFALSGPLPPKEMGIILGVAVAARRRCSSGCCWCRCAAPARPLGLVAAHAGSTACCPTSASDTATPDPCQATHPRSTTQRSVTVTARDPSTQVTPAAGMGWWSSARASRDSPRRSR